MLLRYLTITIAALSLANCSPLKPSPDVPNSQYIRMTHGNGSPVKNKSVIVFVHGVIGDSKATWTNQKNKKYWPTIVKEDCELNNYDIYVASYYSPVFEKAPTIPFLAGNLIDDLKAHRIFERYENIVFVAHSMGNLILRHAAYINKAFAHTPHVLLLSLGSPSSGGEPFANLGALVSDNPQFSEMLKIDNNAYLQTLNQASRSSDQKNIEIACAFEMLPLTINFPSTKFLGIDWARKIVEVKVVDQCSATSVCTKKEYKGILANHIDMVKPLNATDPIHLWLKLSVQDNKRQAPTILLMDSHLSTYREAGMNHTDIENYLEKGPLKVAKFRIETINPGWNSYHRVTDVSNKVDLIVMHFSGFFKNEHMEANRVKAFRAGERELKTFLNKILTASPNTKVLIYSRWHHKFHDIDLGNMNEYVQNNILNGFNETAKQRVFTFDVNGIAGKNSLNKKQINFLNTVIVTELEDKMIEILSPQKASEQCGSNVSSVTNQNRKKTSTSILARKLTVDRE